MNFVVISPNYPESYWMFCRGLKENGAKEVFIFGSIANGKFNINSDIDIAVRGIEADKFYKVASILMFELENEFDLIDLDDKENRFSQMLLKVGGLLKIG